MSRFSAKDPAFERRVRTSFDRQSLNRTIGARLTKVGPGDVEIEVPFREGLGQQHGFMHGGIVSAIADSAGGYAALSLTLPATEVLTVEFKINFLAPATGDRIVARGRVTKAGRTLTVCAGEVFAIERGERKLVASPGLLTGRRTTRWRWRPTCIHAGLARIHPAAGAHVD